MRRFFSAALVALCGSWMLVACVGEIPTELVLVVDTDSAPTLLDTIPIVVSGPSAAEQTVTVPYEGAPRTLGLVAATTVLGPVDIEITGSSSTGASSGTVTRLVHTRFEQGVSRLLHIRLSADCLGRAACVVGETCGPDGACISADVDVTRLPAYLGAVSVPELCNGVDDDGDGSADEDFHLSTDAHHCGACNAPCKPGVLCSDSTCQDSPVIQIAAGEWHTCALRAGGGVACWGANANGELGDGTLTSRTHPVLVRGLTDAVAIGAGYGFSCAVRADATVTCWGSNSCGEIGQPVLEARSVPTAVPRVSGAVELNGGNCHNCARLSSGSIYCWGENTYGQVGNGAMSETPASPTVVMNLANATSVRTGKDHTCALRADGSVSCWGNNTSRQLGDGTETSRSVPTRVVGLPDLTDATMRATAIGAGADFSCALTSSGARCWGANGDGQLGLATGTVWDGVEPTVVPGTSGATALSIGSMGCFGCALGAGGVVSCWGCNGSSQLGDATTTASPTAVRAIGVPAATSISLGQAHACALTASGEVWCWGGNTSGQLGLGSGLPSSPPALVVGL